MHSHFLLLILFAFFVSLVFALIGKDAPRDQLRLGATMFTAFVATAVIIGWLMYPFPF